MRKKRTKVLKLYSMSIWEEHYKGIKIPFNFVYRKVKTFWNRNQSLGIQ